MFKYFFSCSKNDFMFAHVHSCSACSACSQLVQGMFTRPEHAKHAIDCKNGNYFSDHVSFQHFMLRHVRRVQHVSACSHHVLSMFDLCSQKIKAWTYIEHTQTCWTCWTRQNMPKHAAAPWPHFSKSGVKGRQHVFSLFCNVQSMSRHVPCFLTFWT